MAHTSNKFGVIIMQADEPKEYVVSVPNFFLWPFKLVTWAIATVIRVIILIMLIATLITAYDTWTGYETPPAKGPSITHYSNSI